MTIFDAYANFYMNIAIRADPSRLGRTLLNDDLVKRAREEGWFRQSGNEVIIPAGEFLVSLSITLKGGGAWDGALVLFDPSGNGLENMLQTAGNFKRIRLQWGWLDGTGQQTDPTWEGTVAKVVPNYTEAGTTLTLELVASGVYSMSVEKSSTYAAKGAKVDEIVKAQARKYGMRTEVDGVATVQTPENNKLTAPINRAERNVWEYLKELGNRSFGADKFEVYVDAQNVLHFHDKFFNKPDVRAAYIFARDAFGEVISFSPEDDSLMAALKGAQKAEYTCIDSFRGLRLSTSSDVNFIPETSFSGKPKVGPDESYGNVISDGTTFKQHIVARTKEEYDEKLMQAINAARSQPIKATLEVKGTQSVNLMDYVRVTYYMPDGQEHFLSGAYRADEVNHEITASGWTTAFTLSRKGQRKAFDGVTRYDADLQEPAYKDDRLPYYSDGTPRSQQARKQVRDPFGAL